MVPAHAEMAGMGSQHHLHDRCAAIDMQAGLVVAKAAIHAPVRADEDQAWRVVAVLLLDVLEQVLLFLFDHDQETPGLTVARIGRPAAGVDHLLGERHQRVIGGLFVGPYARASARGDKVDDLVRPAHIHSLGRRRVRLDEGVFQRGELCGDPVGPGHGGLAHIEAALLEERNAGLHIVAAALVEIALRMEDAVVERLLDAMGIVPHERKQLVVRQAGRIRKVE